MFQRMLVPLDGSPGAERAIPLAARIARSVGGSIVLLHVIPPPFLGERTSGHIPETAVLVEREEQALLEASNYLASVLAAYAEDLAGTSPEMEVAFGLTSPLLASTARLEQVDLVVMCSHREAGLGQWGSESVAQQAMHRCPGALLILKEQGMAWQPDRTHPLRVVVALDGSLFAETALAPALHLLAQIPSPGWMPSEMHLVRVVANRGPEYNQAESYLQAIKERLQKRFQAAEIAQITASVAIGDEVADTLLAQVNATGFSPLLVMATHGREGVQRLMWGSVAERILDSAACPLLIVHSLRATSRPARQSQVALGKTERG